MRVVESDELGRCVGVGKRGWGAALVAVLGLTLLSGVAQAQGEQILPAIYYKMPGPGTVVIGRLFSNSPDPYVALIYKDSKGRCKFTKINDGKELASDVVIYGTNSADVFIMGSGRFCGVNYEDLSLFATSNYPPTISVYLYGGSDVAVTGHEYVVIRGGDGDDLIVAGTHRDSARPVATFLPIPNLGAMAYGQKGDDWILGFRANGGSGNDVLCAPTPEDIDFPWDLSGSSGTDTYCGTEPLAMDGVERNNSSRYCPKACQGILGW